MEGLRKDWGSGNDFVWGDFLWEDLEGVNFVWIVLSGVLIGLNFNVVQSKHGQLGLLLMFCISIKST